MTVKRIKHDNKGFTLIELIVAVAILAVLTVSVMGFIFSGTGAFLSVYSNVSLQTSTQMVMNQLKEYLIDCNGGVCYAANTLYIVDVDDVGTCTEHVFALNTADRTIRYAVNPGNSQEVKDNGDLMATRVTALTVTTDSAPVGSSATSWKTSTATVEITLSRLGKTYTEVETIALRNVSLTAGNETTLLSAVGDAAAT
jgi:prepilin-type N-terminal cleavage/methylation domain